MHGGTWGVGCQPRRGGRQRWRGKASLLPLSRGACAGGRGLSPPCPGACCPLLPARSALLPLPAPPTVVAPLTRVWKPPASPCSTRPSPPTRVRKLRNIGSTLGAHPEGSTRTPLAALSSCGEGDREARGEGRGGREGGLPGCGAWGTATHLPAMRRRCRGVPPVRPPARPQLAAAGAAAVQAAGWQAAARRRCKAAPASMQAAPAASAAL